MYKKLDAMSSKPDGRSNFVRTRVTRCLPLRLTGPEPLQARHAFVLAIAELRCSTKSSHVAGSLRSDSLAKARAVARPSSSRYSTGLLPSTRAKEQAAVCRITRRTNADGSAFTVRVWRYASRNRVAKST